MKQFYFISLLVYFSILSVFGQTTKKVLFIGNSYTAVNNLPAIVSNMAISTGDVLIYDSNTPGGFRFLNHAADASTLAKINSNTWDYVVLQAQSQEAAFYPAQMEVDLYPYATSLSNSIRQNNECAQPMFYMTWGRKNGDSNNCPYLPWTCTYTAMDDALRASYLLMAENNNAELAPAAAVWRFLRENNSTIELFSSDESHPSLEGSYAAACAFYTMIYKKDPTLINWNPGLNTAIANTIKAAAKTIVYDQMASWDFTVNPASSNFSEVINFGEVSFTNSSATYDSSLWDFGDGTTSTASNPTHNYASSGFYTISLTTVKCGKSNTITKTIVIDSVLNANDFGLKNNIKIYPNPANDALTLTLNKNYSTVSVVLFDVLGTAVMKKDVENASNLNLDITNLNTGTYLLKVIADDMFFTSRIVKK
jgi:PKD repeat protein